MKAAKQEIGFTEFVALAGALVMIVALSIDIMLPTLGVIDAELGSGSPNDRQLVITLFFIGFSVGQIFVGPLTDSFGRKPMIYAGFALYLVGGALCLMAQSLDALLIGRVVQGLGAAGPRIVINAVIRDRYQGRMMARVTSLVMMVFILAPIFAPLLGQGIISAFGGWRPIFWALILFAVAATLWTVLRLPETLPRDRRPPLSFSGVWRAVRAVVNARDSMLYTLSMGCAFGGFLGFLSTAQQLLGEAYGLGESFVFAFAALAAAVGGSSLLNAKLVLQHGMRRLSSIGLCIMIGSSAIFWLWAMALGPPPLWGVMLWLGCAMGALGIVFGNLNALAMDPLGAFAGVGASIVGAASSFIGAVTGGLIGHGYDGEAAPIALGMTIFSALSLLAMRRAGRARA